MKTNNNENFIEESCRKAGFFFYSNFAAAEFGFTFSCSQIQTA